MGHGTAVPHLRPRGAVAECPAPPRIRHSDRDRRSPLNRLTHRHRTAVPSVHAPPPPPTPLGRIIPTKTVATTAKRED